MHRRGPRPKRSPLSWCSSDSDGNQEKGWLTREHQVVPQSPESPLMKRSLTAGAAILVAWMLVDLVAHRFFLAPIYRATANLWRPFEQMNVVLIYAVTVVLIAVFVGIYALLVNPKSLGAGIALGAFVGLALGISSGFGTFIHMPIPLALAWGWFIAGWLKGLVAGGIVGAVIVES